MSRGPGYMQQFMLGVIGQSDKPMTFAEIAARARRPDVAKTTNEKGPGC